MKDHLMQMVAVLIFSCIFILIFYLYGIPVKIYSYAFTVFRGWCCNDNHQLLEI